MQFDIQARNFSLTEAMRQHAERRLRFALTRSDDHIQRVLVRLSDINGPRGGADKRCHLVVVLEGLPDVVVEDIQADLYVAIDRATDRAGRTVARKIDRHQCLDKKDYALGSAVTSAERVPQLDNDAPEELVDQNPSDSRTHRSS